MKDSECRDMLTLKVNRTRFNDQWKVCKLFDEIRDARNLPSHPSNRKDFTNQVVEVLKSLEPYIPLNDPKMEEVYWILKNKDGILSFPNKNRKPGWKDGWVAEAGANSSPS
jgi:hypothetical protein